MTQEILEGEGTFTCDVCGGVFIKGYSEEEAVAESTKAFGRPPEDNWGVVCEDCFKKVMSILAQTN